MAALNLCVFAGWHGIAGTLSRARLLVLLFGFLILQSGGSFVAQAHYSIQHWQAEEGLPQNTGTSILQTRDGYIWIGTYDGLARFNGQEFRIFSAANTPELRVSHIRTLHEDKRGVLWIGTDGGGVTLYENGKFHSVSGTDALEHLSIICFGEDRQNRIWMGTYDGLHYVEPVQEQPSRFQLVNVWTNVAILQLGFAQNGTIWARGLDHKIVRFSSSHEFLGTLPRQDDVQSLSVTADDRVWTGSVAHGVVVYDQGQEIIHDQFKGEYIHCIYHARNGDVWIATQVGTLYRWRDGQLLKLDQNSRLPDFPIVSITEDRENNLWIGTDGGGVVRLRENTLRTYSSENGLSGNDVATILQDRTGKLWVGVYDEGLNILHNGEIKVFSWPTDIQPIPSVVSVVERRDGTIWIGTRTTPLLAWDGERLVPRQHVGPINVLFEDRDRRLWAGSSINGLFRETNTETGAFEKISGLPNEMISAIVQDPQGTIWVGTSKGLGRWSEGRFQRWYTVKDGLGADTIQTLYVDKEGMLWIGTAGGGLSRFKNNQFQSINTSHGLVNNVVAQILEDDAGDLWIGTNNGIFQAAKAEISRVMDSRKGFVYGSAYGKNSGLLHLECAGRVQPNCLKDNEGRLWFSTVGGLAMIDPKRIVKNQVVPPVYIESVEVEESLTYLDEYTFDRDKSTSSIAPTPLITVPAGAQQIEIAYTALSYVAPEKVRFRYKLEGLDHDWHNVGSQRKISYTRLSPGHYQLRVTACNNSGVWNETGASLLLVVQPYIWETTWFGWSLGAAILGTGLGLYRIRTSRLKELALLRSRIAGDLHDDVGSNLGSIALQTELLQKIPSLSPEQRERLRQVNHLAMRTVHSIRDIVWFINPEFDTISDMVARMKEAASNLLAETPLEFSHSESSGDRKLSLELRRNLFFDYKEILHNIAKHARATYVQIHLQWDDSHMEMTIKDNGQGFDEEKLKRKNGLNNLRRRTAELNGTISIESRPGAGTLVRVKVPIT